MHFLPKLALEESNLAPSSIEVHNLPEFVLHLTNKRRKLLPANLLGHLVFALDYHRLQEVGDHNVGELIIAGGDKLLLLEFRYVLSDNSESQVMIPAGIWNVKGKGKG